MLHTSISCLLLAAPFVCCIWAAAGAGLGRKQEETSGPDDAVPAPLPDVESAAGRVRTQVGNLNGRLANFDAKLLLLAEANKQLVQTLRSCTAQLCLAQAEMGNDKDELALSRARIGQLEMLDHEQREQLERGALRLRELEAELAARTRTAETAAERLAEAERAFPERMLELDGRLSDGQRELAQRAEQLAVALQRCEDLEEDLTRLDEEFRRQLETQRAAESRSEQREHAHSAQVGTLQGQLAQRDQVLRERVMQLESLRSELAQAAARETERSRRCTEIEQELRLQDEARRQIEVRAAGNDEELRERATLLESLRNELAQAATREAERSRRCTELEEELRLEVEEQRRSAARAGELEQELATRIAELEARAGRRDEELRERAAALEALRGELAGESQRGAEQARRRAELETELQQRTLELQAGQGRVRELETRLGLCERELQERSAAAEELGGRLARDEAGSARLGARCEELGQQLGLREQELAAERGEFAALSARCAGLSRTLEDRDRDLGEQQQRLAQARARIGVLEAEGARRAGLHATELLLVDELAQSHLAAVLHGHAGQRPRALPPAYLAGLEQHDLNRALSGLLGGPGALSSDSMLQLGEHWQRQKAAWNREPIEGQVVYLWAAAPEVRVGLETEGAALLVIVAGMLDGSRRVLSVESGARESADAWFACLERLARRGMNLPRLVIGEDGMGLWSALERAGWNCAQQRSWERRIEHVVEALPKRQQRKAGELLRAVAKAKTRAEAERRKRAWVKRYVARRPEAVARIEADWEQLLSLYEFPAAHWSYLRNTAIVESLLASLRLHTRRSKAHPPSANAEALIWKLLQIEASGLRKLNSPQLMPAVASGAACSDGEARQRAA